MKTYAFLLFFSVLAFFVRVQAQPVGAGLLVEPIPINLDELKRVIGYPMLAKEDEIYGDVLAAIKIDSTGHYLEHYLLYSCHPILGDAVEAQLSNLRFVPGKMDGKPRPFWVTIPFNFRMLGNDAGSFSEPAGGGFMLLTEKERKPIADPFGTTHAAILKKVGKRKVNGKPVAGQVYLKMDFNAQYELENCYFLGSGNPQIQRLVEQQLEQLIISPDAGLNNMDGPFSLFIPFSFR
jgi:Gram-negative bacterial TonB protein C-terminal